MTRKRFVTMLAALTTAPLVIVAVPKIDAKPELLTASTETAERLDRVVRQWVQDELACHARHDGFLRR